MISVYFNYHNPKCDGCGRTLKAERDDAAAEDAMRADGWERIEGRDLCRLCQKTLKETGKLPEKGFFRRESTWKD